MALQDAPVYELCVLGAGPAGYVAALRAAQLGATVALIEEEEVGGTCLNHGCIPTKALVESGRALRMIRRASEYGLRLDGRVEADFAAVVARKDRIVGRLVRAVKELLLQRGVSLIRGRAAVQRAGSVVISTGGEPVEVRYRSLLVATGSRPLVPEIEGRELGCVLDVRRLLGSTRLPRSLVVVGGSAVGIEMSDIYASFGTRVTVLEKFSILPRVDQQLARRYLAIATRRGIAIQEGADVQSVEQLDTGMARVHYVAGGAARYVDGELVLLATGRQPNSAGLGLERLGVAITPQGAIQVDSCLRTAVPGIYAAGDVVGGWMLAHVAAHEGLVAAENALGGERHMDYSAVPNCIFTEPEIASVGMTEVQARTAGFDAQVCRFPFSANGRAMTMGEEEGVVRLVYERGSGRILGVHILGPLASELIVEGALAVKEGLNVRQLAEIMHQHPTLSEAVMEAGMAAAYGEALHFRAL